tara:strand:+ start:2024 stop:2179 length:156 start_codon:yes stop_codon:yes gene_type:complete
MKDVVIKNITDKADELAREYNRTKDPKIKEEWFKLVRKIQLPPEHKDYTQI